MIDSIPGIPAPRKSRLAIFIICVSAISGISHSSSSAFQSNREPAAKSPPGGFRYYRAPFESVTRLFPAGTELESLSYDEFSELVAEFEAAADSPRSVDAFAGTVDHEIEFRTDTLKVRTRFAKAKGEVPGYRYRSLPEWFDISSFTRSKVTIEDGGLVITPGGRQTIDTQAAEPEVRWSVPAAGETDGPILRFPFRSPQGLVTRLILKTPKSFAPSSDRGIWNREPNAPGETLSWLHIGPEPPREIVIRNITTEKPDAPATFDASSVTEWTITDEQCTGQWSATFWPRAGLTELAISLSDQVIVTRCRVDEVDTEFVRSGERLTIPIRNENGEPVSVILEMKSSPPGDGATKFPLVRPLTGTWFRNRIVWKDFRLSPVSIVTSEDGLPVPVSIAPSVSLEMRPRILSFSADARQSSFVIRSAKSQPMTSARLVGEYLIRNRSHHCAIRLSAPPIQSNRPTRFDIVTEMKPIRAESYRIGQNGARTRCDFEIIENDSGFRLQAIPSDSTKGTLTFDLLLESSAGAGADEVPLRIPRIESSNGLTIESVWAVLTDVPQLRLDVEPAPKIRWDSIKSSDNQSGLLAYFGFGLVTKRLALWNADSSEMPVLSYRKPGYSETTGAGKSLVIAVIEPARERIHVLRIEPATGSKSEGRELRDRPLSNAANRFLGITPTQSVQTNGRTVQEPESAVRPRFGLRSFSFRQADRSMPDLAASLNGSDTVGILIGETSGAADSVEPAAIDDSYSDSDLAALAVAATNFLKSILVLSETYIDPSGKIRAFSSTSAWIESISKAARERSSDVSGELASTPKLLTGPIDIVTRVEAVRSVTHRLITRVYADDARRLLINPADGFRVSAIRVDSRDVPFAHAPNGLSIDLPLPEGDAELAIDLESNAVDAEKTIEGGFLDLNVFDMPTTWTVESADSSWFIRSRSGSERVPDQPDFQPLNRVATSFRRLIDFEADCRSLRESAASSRYTIPLALWAASVAAAMAALRFRVSSVYVWPAFGMATFLVLYSKTSTDDSFFVTSAMTLAIFAATVVRKRIRMPARVSAVAIGLLTLSQDSAAQPMPVEAPIRVVLPFAALEDAFSTPRRVILPKPDLDRLRNSARRSDRSDVAERLLFASARHEITPTGNGSFQLKSVYRTLANLVESPDQTLTSISVALPFDDALTVRAFAGEKELAIRVNTTDRRLEIRFETPLIGEMTVLKSFPPPQVSAGGKVIVFPTFRSRIVLIGQGRPDAAKNLRVKFDKDWVDLQYDEETSLNLVREFLVNHGPRDDVDSPQGVVEPFPNTIRMIRTTEGLSMIAQIHDAERIDRILTLSPETYFVDAIDCRFTILENTADGKRRVRIHSDRDRDRYEIRLFRPLAQADSVDSDWMSFDPPTKNHRAILWTATEGGVTGNWEVLSEVARRVAAPAGNAPSTLIEGSNLKETARLDDWRSLRLRFRTRSPKIDAQVEGLLTLFDNEIRGTYSTTFPISQGDGLVRECRVTFDESTRLTEVIGDDVLDWGSIPASPGSWFVKYVAGSDALTRFELLTRSAIVPQNAGETSSTTEPAALPWPRFDSNGLPAGRLVVERRIDQESPFRSGPMRYDDASLESLGEIRTTETPTNIGRWLYTFRGSSEAPLVRWQIPAVFSLVGVEHALDVDESRIRWNCRVTYEPTDGPLRSMLVVIDNEGMTKPVFEIDRPEVFDIERRDEPFKSQLRITPKKGILGVTSFRLRSDVRIAAAASFRLPSVSPLGHGRVDKQVSLSVSKNLDLNADDLEIRGLQEVPPTSPPSRENSLYRLWKFRSADATLILRLPKAESAQAGEFADTSAAVSPIFHDLAVRSTTDGRHFWTGTANRNDFAGGGAEWPADLGEIQAFDSRAIPLSLSHEGDRLRLSGDPGGVSQEPILVRGVVPADRWSLWLEYAVIRPSRKQGVPIAFASESTLPDRVSADFRPSGISQWLVANFRAKEPTGATPENAEARGPGEPSPLESETLARIRFHMTSRPGDAALVTAYGRLRDEAGLGNSGSSGNRRFATRFVDELIAADPQAWRFFTYSGVKTGSSDFRRWTTAIEAFWLGASMRHLTVAAFLSLIIASTARPLFSENSKDKPPTVEEPPQVDRT